MTPPHPGPVEPLEHQPRQVLGCRNPSIGALLLNLKLFVARLRGVEAVYPLLLMDSFSGSRVAVTRRLADGHEQWRAVIDRRPLTQRSVSGIDALSLETPLCRDLRR